MRAGPLRGVERKGVRRRFVECDTAGRTHQVAAVKADVVRIVIVNHHRPFALPHRLLQAFEQPFADILFHHEPVDDQLDMVDFITVELHPGMHLTNLTVHTGIEVAFFNKTLEQFAVVSFTPADQRRQQRDLAPGKIAQDQVDDLRIGMVYHQFARDGRIGVRRPREKQAEKIVDLGHGADRRTGILVGRLLLDRNYRTEARDLIHIGTFHRADELARIGGKRLQVTALTLGIDRVEGERRFARTGQAGDNGQGIARDDDIHIFEVVLACSVNFDPVFSRKGVYIVFFRFHQQSICGQRFVIILRTDPVSISSGVADQQLERQHTEHITQRFRRQEQVIIGSDALFFETARYPGHTRIE